MCSFLNDNVKFPKYAIYYKYFYEQLQSIVSIKFWILLECDLFISKHTVDPISAPVLPCCCPLQSTQETALLSIISPSLHKHGVDGAGVVGAAVVGAAVVGAAVVGAAVVGAAVVGAAVVGAAVVGAAVVGAAVVGAAVVGCAVGVAVVGAAVVGCAVGVAVVGAAVVGAAVVGAAVVGEGVGGGGSSEIILVEQQQSLFSFVSTTWLISVFTRYVLPVFILASETFDSSKLSSDIDVV
jgi:hypothetical protein